MEEWIRFELSLKVSWSVAMEAPLTGMKPSLLLTGVECGFIKPIAMSKLVPTRQRNKTKPIKIL